MVAVPHFCPDVPPLRSNPVFLFYSDAFQKPNPFQADVAVSGKAQPAAIAADPSV